MTTNNRGRVNYNSNKKMKKQGIIQSLLDTNLNKIILSVFILFLSQTVSAVALTNNSVTTNIDGALDSTIFYTIDVPAGAANLTFDIAGSNGDADIYIKFGSAPSLTVYDYRPYLVGSNETVNISVPSAGTYHIMIHGYAAYTALTLSVSYTDLVITPITSNPATINNIDGTSGSEIRFSIEIPKGSSNLEFKITGSTGDADLYVKLGSLATLTNYDYRPYIGGSNETVSILAPTEGTYNIMIQGYTAYSALTLSVSYLPPDSNGFLQFLNKSAPRNNELSGNRVAQSIANGNTTPQLTNDAGAAYYQAVDPNNLRGDLASFKAFNNNLSDIPNAVYVNDADLGFGRRMYLTVNPKGSVSSCVENYAPLDANGLPNVNAPANEKLTLAHGGDQNLIIATVCMEYSGTPGSGTSVETLTGRKYVKFFSFGANGVRITEADLDGRGLKTQPGLCNTCHGGQGNSLISNADGSVTYPLKGDTGAQFLPWDLDTFIYAEDPTLSAVDNAALNASARATLEPLLKQFNVGVIATYPINPTSFSFKGNVVIPTAIIPTGTVDSSGNPIAAEPSITTTTITVNTGTPLLITDFVFSIDDDSVGGPGLIFPNTTDAMGFTLISPSGKEYFLDTGFRSDFSPTLATGVKNLYISDNAETRFLDVSNQLSVINGNVTGVSRGDLKGFINNSECVDNIAVPFNAVDMGCTDANGIWSLRIQNVNEGTGSIKAWSIHFNGVPEAAYLPAPVELIRGWYGGADLPLAEFNGGYVPDGWLAANNSNAVANPETLYLDVLGPTCRACHVQRGTMANNDIDFSTYDKFMKFADNTKSLVYEKGVMPLAKRTFESHFWNSDKPNILASHMNGNTSELLLGRNVANAGIDRVGGLAVAQGSQVTLNGSASLYPNDYAWTVTAPDGTAVTLNVNPILDAQGNRVLSPTDTSFILNQLGLYQIKLDTSGISTSTVNSIATTTIESSADITPVIFTEAISNTAAVTDSRGFETALSTCSSSRCHGGRGYQVNRRTGNLNFIQTDRFEPVTDAQRQENHRLLRDRIDTFLPLDSLTIRKGLNKIKHGGKGRFITRTDKRTLWNDTTTDITNIGKISYETFLRWILEGGDFK